MALKNLYTDLSDTSNYPNHNNPSFNYGAGSPIFGGIFEQLGFEFNQGSNPTPKHFKVIGLKTRSRKYPIQCKDVNSDDIYGFKIDWVNVEYEKINAIHETIKTDDFDSGEG